MVKKWLSKLFRSPKSPKDDITTARRESEIQKKMKHIQNIDTQLLSLDNQIEEAKRKKSDLMNQRWSVQGMPSTWSNNNSENKILVEVTHESDQFWSIHDKLRETMDDAWISKIWHVQNSSLWTYYSFQKSKLTMAGINHNERHVWHGTSSLDPSVIYNDQKDGFTMQFSIHGAWGEGIYFSNQSCFSDQNSYEPSRRDRIRRTTERPDFMEGEKEMFLAKLLVGNEIRISRSHGFTSGDLQRMTEVDVKSGTRYITVTGEDNRQDNKSNVWIVYENGRAYPDYLVRYYNGQRDPERTPYRTREEASRKKHSKRILTKGDKDLPEFLTTLAMSDPHTVQWEFFDVGWVPYLQTAHEQLEAAYLNSLSDGNEGNYDVVRVKGIDFSYDVNIKTMTQTNVEIGTKRDVRRYVSYRAKGTL
uniref:WWE domain-containing protein n=1 Tax=Ditylum brightwellii TaxID=49249 RepID=A0A6V2BF44_9STRA